MRKFLLHRPSRGYTELRSINCSMHNVRHKDMWPFKKRQQDISNLPLLSDDCHRWGVATTEIDSSPLIIRFSESARDWVGHSGLPVRLGFVILLNSPNRYGLPGPDENKRIYAIEGIVIREIESRSPALHALVLTTGVMKEMIFYIPRGVDIKTIHESVQAAVGTHEVQCRAVLDSKWDCYLQFVPHRSRMLKNHRN